VNLANRQSTLLTTHIDHLRAIWRLPHDEADYPKRWSQSKAGFSRELPKVEAIRTH